MNSRTIVVTGLVGVGILILVAIAGVLLLGDRAPRAPAPPAPAALEPRSPPPAGERR